MKTAKKPRRKKVKLLKIEQPKITKSEAEEYKEKLQVCLHKYWSTPKATGHIQAFEHTMVYTLLLPVKYAGIFLKYFKAEHGIENLSYNYLNNSNPEYIKVFINKRSVVIFTKRLYTVTNKLIEKLQGDITNA